VAALLYPLLTSWLTGFQRNYLEAYGLNDLLYLWFVSILAGILAFIIAMTYRWLKRRYLEQQLKARTFVVGDEPLVVLQKLRKQGLTLALDAARYVHDEQEYRVRLLQARQETAEKYWIAPQICVANRAELSGEERSAVEQAINYKDIGGVLDLKHKIRLSWKVKEEQDLYWPPNASSPLQVEAAAIKGFVENASDEGLLLPEC
jgi:hypothetical protein